MNDVLGDDDLSATGASTGFRAIVLRESAFLVVAQAGPLANDLASQNDALASKSRDDDLFCKSCFRLWVHNGPFLSQRSLCRLPFMKRSVPAGRSCHRLR